MLPWKNFDPNVWCGAIWGRPKVYYQPKNQQFLGKKARKKQIAIFLSHINLDDQVCRKINTFKIYKGGLQKKFLKTQTKWRLFLIFFLLFGKAP